MEPQEKSIYDMVKENNILLHKINRREKVRNVFSIIKISLIIGLTIASYILFQPYFNKLTQTYQAVSDGSQKVKDIGANFQFDNESLKDLFSQ